MDAEAIAAVLDACERELAAGRAPDLRALGFWCAVAAVKRDEGLTARFADRIALTDRAAFRRSVPLRLPAAFGLAILGTGALVGTILLLAAAALDRPLRELALLAGAAALDGTTHGLAHFVVGSLAGIRFTDAFVDLPTRPQPGLKIDYATYLRAPARARAWMHAAGAIATKLTPFAALLVGIAIGSDGWALAILATVGLLQLVTDLLFSVRSSDWKKFKREMRMTRR